MKKTNHLSKNLILQVLVTFLVALFANADVVAQQAKATANTNDPVQKYMLKNPDSPVVKMLQANPGNDALAQAVKIEMILSNPGGYPEFSQQDLDRMHQESSFLSQNLKEIQMHMDNGATFNAAKSKVMEKAGQNNAGSQGEAPALMVAPN